MDWLAQASIGWLITALIQLLLHWFPWRLALKHIMPWAMVAGVLGMAAPLTGILLLWIKQYPNILLVQVLIALWGTVICTILSVFFGYFVDWILTRRRLSDELRQYQELKDDQTRKTRHTSRK